MRLPPFAVLLVTVGICLSACEKPKEASPPASRVSPTPRPKDELDPGTNRLKARAEGALNAVENYFVGQNPKAKAKLQKAADKFTRDKAKWREKLQEQQRELQPQIDRLREQAEKLDTAENRERVRADLKRLEDESRIAAQRLSELEAAGQEGWHAFKESIQASEAKSPTPAPSRPR